MKNGIKYHPQVDGEWIEPKQGYRMACCDCGLVHRVEFRVVKGKVQFRAWRDKKATDKRRRECKIPTPLQRGLYAKILQRNIELQHKLDAAYNDINAIRPTVAAYVAGRNIIAAAGPEMDVWLKRVKS